MFRYLIGFESEELVNIRRRELFLEIYGNKAGTTKYINGFLKHPEKDEFAIEISTLTESNLSPSEISELKSFSEMDAAGWFPKQENDNVPIQYN